MKNITFLALMLFLANSANSQCENWNDSPDKDQLEEYHVLYQQAVEEQNWDEAFANWSKVFPVAPAADGKRISQYLEGITIYNAKFKASTDEAEKKDNKAKAIAIYDQLVECYKGGGIATKDEADLNKKLGFVYGRKAFDMFYVYNSLYSQTLAAIDEAIAFGGNDNEYIIFAPAASIVAYNIKKGSMEKSKAVELYTQLNEIADHNINKEDDMSALFSQAKENMNGTFATVEDDIFDCEYFKDKLTPDYESDPENPEVLKYIIVTLKQKGCPVDDPFLADLEIKWAKYAAEYNAAAQAEFEANNPAVLAKKLYDEGKFADAVAKYDEAIAQESDNSKKASYVFSKASIQFRKMSKYSTARATAYKAAELRPGWGRPYLLIGDMYAKGSRSCGDAWNQRLAILAAIGKYQKAKSIDPSIADDANRRIRNYAKSKPDKDTGFMKGVKEGDSAKVGCWIGETVRISY
jgi:hypothetical protein